MSMTTMVSPTTSSSAATLDARALMRWYRQHGRHALPWRQTTDRYAIFVSEVMLQQTQVARVIPYWMAWMERWPTMTSLASASRADLIRAWSGLGYNNRAVRLHEAAQVCVNAHGAVVPDSELELRALPGVGSYTANAVLCFSDRSQALPLDTNVARVLARAALGVEHPRSVAMHELRHVAAAATPVRNSRSRAAALMDLGAILCSATAPNCRDCPIAKSCAWRRLDYPASERCRTIAERFEETARWARGRIVDVLRNGPTSEAELRRGLPEQHRSNMSNYLESLRRDGLIECESGLVALAGDHTMSIASPKL
jgi:A/G-specific adenine glycosylase